MKSNITVPAGVTVRTTSRTGESITVATDKATVIPSGKEVLKLSSNGKVVILAFQFKGRRATVKLYKVASVR